MSIEMLQERLALIVSLSEQIEELEGQVKNLKNRREAAKKAAVQDIEESKLDKVVACGRSWRVQYDHHLSVPADRRDEAIEAARAMGIDTETMLTVNTSRLKATLKERCGGRKSAWTAGTPLEGVVEEYVAPALYAVSAGPRSAKEE